MDENLSGQAKLFNDETKPFRGFITKTVARMQLGHFLPDLFTAKNSISEGLFSGDGIYISVADGKQIRYSFNHPVLGETMYSLAELAVYHQELVQSENGYAYGGWSVHLQMSSPVVRQHEPQMLQIEWNGKEKFGESDMLEMRYTDVNGHGQRMTLHIPEQTLELPHLHETFSFTDPVDLALIQAEQPFVFDQIAVSDTLVGIAFHGNEQNKIKSQKILLPAAMHVQYAR